MKAQYWDELFKDKKVQIPPNANLYLAILEAAQALRDEIPGHTVFGIESSNELWVGRNVAVLPDPRSSDISKSIRIQPKTGLKPNELKITYYDAKEVGDFFA